MSAKILQQETENGPRCFEPFLSARLLKNAAVKEVRRTPETLILSVPQAAPQGLLAVAAWIARPAAEKQYELDHMGREIYEMCDGRNAEEMIRALAEKEALTFHEARVALAEFGARLIQRGLVVVEK